MEIHKKNNELPDDNLGDNLLAALQRCTQFDPPADFLTNTVTRFETAVHRKFIAAIAVGIAAVLSISTPLLWFILLHMNEVTKTLAALVSGASIVLAVLITMWNQLPEIITGITLSMWISLFIVAALLVKIWNTAIPNNNVAH